MKLTRTQLVSLILISVLGSTVVTLYLAPIFGLDVGDVSTFYMDRGPRYDAAYIVGEWNSTHYYMMNGTTGQREWVSSDADAVINAALGNCTATSQGLQRVVLIGDFTIDSTIYVGSYDELDMRQAEINLQAGSECNIMNISTGNNNRNGAYVHGGRLIGDSGGSVGHGIQIWKGAQSTLEDISIEYTAQNGLDIDSDIWAPTGDWAGFHNIRNVHVWYAGDDGFHVDKQVDNYFYRCIAQQCGEDGFELYGTNMLVECHPVNNARYNFYVPTSASSNQFIDCYSNIAGRNCWRILSDGSRLVNPHADYASQETTNTYDAIYVDADHVQIIGGSIRGDGSGSYPDDARWGIYLSSGSDYCTVTGPRCYNAATGQIYNGGGSDNKVAGWNGTTWANNW